MPANLQRGFRLGDYEIRPLQGEIDGPNGVRHLQPKVVDVLLRLAESAGELVEREALIERAWGRKVIGDEVLTRCISELRHALDDHPEHPRYIQTIPKRGYRLLIPPQGLERTTEMQTVTESGTAVEAFSSAPRHLPRQRARWISVLGTVGMIMAATVYYVLTPSSPTFAFKPREWVVLAGFQDDAGPVSGSSLTTAFRIGLEQSSYVNADPEIRDALVRMRLEPDTRVDKAIGIEIAAREGAKALLLGNIASVGSQIVLALEVIDPRDGRTVFARSATADGPDTVLRRLDELTRLVRRDLGESLKVIEAAQPLYRVTTANLDALRAYSTALDEVELERRFEATDLLERAIELDPGFAMAHALLGAILNSMGTEWTRAQEHWNLALEASDRLPKREELLVRAFHASAGDVATLRRQWYLLSALYPDFQSGHFGLGQVDWYYRSSFADAAESFAKAASLPGRSRDVALLHLAYCQLGLGQLQQALENFHAAHAINRNPINAGLADGYIALKDYDKADSYLHEVLDSEVELQRLWAAFRLVLLHVDRGRFVAALEATNAVEAIATRLELPIDRQQAAMARLAMLERSGDTEAFSQELAKLTDNMSSLLDDGRADPASVAAQLAFVGKIAVRNQQLDGWHDKLSQAVARSTCLSVKMNGMPAA